jgi:hypothetical protein
MSWAAGCLRAATNTSQARNGSAAAFGDAAMRFTDLSVDRNSCAAQRV